MKGYGLPRNKDVESPDCGDIRNYGLASHAGNLPGKGGDIRSSFRKSARKRAIRRYWKRIARRINLVEED